ncbi:bacillithiol system redox-active protein YtxJ [Flammeovirgaceae bacterium SG7u.111]|nr:bacillithiol system redox-active protein YtxJ [Flammeovirgaceae bacterium SG7u.132]WPO34540.1 bacillithiol system redox-active protein YtxJ [Flammeovirgaceae bacterium SG7u.111]
MNWESLTKTEELEEIKKLSANKKVLIFKHSTRCSVSAMAYDRLKRSWNEKEMEGVTPYYLDLIRFREISNKIVEEFDVEHQSPQVLLIEDGKCVFHDSHFGINYQEIKKMSAA